MGTRGSFPGGKGAGT